MTVEPEDKKFSLSIWLRQPARKIRMENVSGYALDDLANAMASERWTEVHGRTKAGGVVVIPASNVAYIEAVEL